MIDKDIQLTRYLGELIESANDFEIASAPSLAVVCFRYLGDLNPEMDASKIDQLNREIIPALEKDGRVFITGTTLNKRPVIRACLINHRLQVQNIDYLFSVIRAVGQQVLSTKGQVQDTA